eukprot:9019311-Pyramimonas_sp.AAC.1
MRSLSRCVQHSLVKAHPPNSDNPVSGPPAPSHRGLAQASLRPTRPTCVSSAHPAASERVKERPSCNTDPLVPRNS